MRDDIGYANNPEPRCPCLLMLDTSHSMTMQSENGVPIDELNKGLRILEEDLKKDRLASKRVEVGIITFGGSVDIVQEFITIDQFKAPTLQGNGHTPMGEAAETALEMVRKRQKFYKSNNLNSFKPWIFIISDGYPTDDHWESKANIMKQKAEKILVWPVGVEDADLNALAQFSIREPKLLKGLCFRELFRWISESMSQVSSSSPGDGVKLKTTQSWEELESV